MWARDRETFGEDRRHWSIEAKERMQWLAGFEHCADLAETLPDTRLVYVADRECDIHEVMVQTQHWPGYNEPKLAAALGDLRQGSATEFTLSEKGIISSVHVALSGPY